MKRNLKIAVADDEPRVREYYQEFLSSLGHDVVAAADGADLVHSCLSNRRDLIITDLIMPKMDGVEAADEIRREYPIPVIIVSAYYDTLILNRIVDHDIHVYLVKPIKQSDLVSSIAVAVRLFDQIQSIRREVEGFERAIDERNTIERGKHILMDITDLDEDSAYRRLRKVSRDRNLKLVDVARSILLSDEACRR
jgi:response regulator NasT